jgi:hypothetical protein
MTVSYEKKKQGKTIKKVEKVTKTFLRLAVLILFFHWKFFTNDKIEEHVGYGETLREDPMRAILIKPSFSIISYFAKNKYTSFFLETALKALVFKLISDYISYSLQSATNQKELTNLSDPYLDERKIKKIEKKFLLWLKRLLLNVLFSLTFHIALSFHNYVFQKKKELPLMKKELNSFELLGINVCFQLFLRISQEFIHQRRILNKKETKIFLVKELPSLVGENFVNIFFMPRILPLSYRRDLGDVSIMTIRAVVDFLISNVKLLFFSPKSAGDNKNSKNNGEVDWKNKIIELEKLNF